MAFKMFDPKSAPKEESRVIHPIYATLSKIGPFADNPMPSSSHKSMQRRSSEYQKVSENSGYYRQMLTSEVLGEPSTDSKYSRIETSSSTNGLMSTGQDIFTEKNKKSSIEPKRFYHRKLSGLSGVKLPIGRFFKLFRPPLERRNSCPVISSSDKIPSRLIKENSILRSENSQSKINSESDDQKKNCRLTKWTSHSELLQSELNQRVIPLPKDLSEENFSTAHDDKHSVNTITNIPEISNSDQFISTLEVGAKDIPSSEFNYTEASNTETNIAKESTEPFLLEKTVIIVSENTSLHSTCSNGISYRTPSLDTKDYFKADSLSMNTHVNTLSCNNNFETIQKQSVNNQVKIVNNSQCENDVLFNSLRISKTDLKEYPLVNKSTREYINYNTNEKQSLVECINGNSLLKLSNGNVSLESSESVQKNALQISLQNIDNEDQMKKEYSRNSDLNYQYGKDIKNLKDAYNEDYLENVYQIKANVDSENNENSVPKITIEASDTVSNGYANLVNNQPIYATISKIRKKQKITTNTDPNTEEGNSTLTCQIPDEKETEKNSALERITAITASTHEINYPSTTTNNKEELLTKNHIQTSSTEAKDIIQFPHSISILCNQIGSDDCDLSSQNSSIKVNNASSQPNSLDFGEYSSNTSVVDLQNDTINECYNVKLDAPEEVIVAGFHDFCHTTLSLEESIEANETGRIKRRFETTAQKMISTEKSTVCTTQTSEHKLNGIKKVELNSMPQKNLSLKHKEDSASNFEDSKKYPDKLLEEIQNSKLIEKISIKDPDVIDAIRFFDKSLMEVSEDSTELEICNSSLSMESIYGKVRPKISKEDKIQSDNLIEELMLADVNKSILTQATQNALSIVHGETTNLTASNLSSDKSPASQSVYSNVNSEMKKMLSESSVESIESNNYWLNMDSKNNSDISDISNYNVVKMTHSEYSSEFCEPDDDTNKVNIISEDYRQDTNSLPVSFTSDDSSSSAYTVEPSSAPIHQTSIGNRTSPCSVDSGTSSHNHSYFVVVAIDFGTTYSGYAFSFTRDPENIHMMKKWDGGDPGIFNQKTPTILLLSPDGAFHSFGYSARDYYHDLDTEEAKDWLYFEKFKMTLHYSEFLSLDTWISAANGKRVPAITIFAYALRFFKEHALQELSDQSATRIVNEDVRWVVTVPAIWKQPAKQFMREAAYKAGIASPDYPDQLLIALEPEAASIYCRRIKLHQLIPDDTHFQRSSFSWKTDTDSEAPQDERDTNHTNMSGQGNESAFSVGTRYMVVDCGGGTVDITVHELLDNQGTLKELLKASGGPYGSIGVDMEFENLLCDIFGEDFIQQFKTNRPTGYVDLMVAFEARKRNVNPYKTNSLNISLPFSFIDYFKEYKGSSVESAIKKSSHKNIKWSSQGMLRLEHSLMEALFKKTIEEIKKHILNIICQKDTNVNHIFLVGGFAESLILQKEIKDAFSSNVKVVIPQGVSLAILKGAVLFGLDPTTVNIRRLRMTYGVGILNRFIHGVHPREKLVIKDGIQWCADVFDKFVENEQSVGVGDVVVRRYTPAKDGQSCSVIHIYCSEKDNAYFITDPGVKRCATLILDLSDSRYIKDREIQTQMMFGDTEIKVSALDVTTGKCVKAEIDFLNQ